MLSVVDEVFAAGTTLAVGAVKTPFYHVRGAKKVMFVFKCTSAQTGTITPNYGWSEFPVDGDVQEVSQSVNVSAAGASSPVPAGQTWVWFGANSLDTDENLIARWVRCRMVIGTANITNMQMFIIRQYDTYPSETNNDGAGLPDIVPAP